MTPWLAGVLLVPRLSAPRLDLAPVLGPRAGVEVCGSASTESDETRIRFVLGVGARALTDVYFLGPHSMRAGLEAPLNLQLGGYVDLGMRFGSDGLEMEYGARTGVEVLMLHERQHVPGRRRPVDYEVTVPRPIASIFVRTRFPVSDTWAVRADVAFDVSAHGPRGHPEFLVAIGPSWRPKVGPPAAEQASDGKE